MIDIIGIDKAAVLAALYNNTKAQGMGWLHYEPEPMTTAQAQGLIDTMNQDDLYFDYVGGRVIKTDLSGTEFDPWGYDRDNGVGAAQRAIDTLQEARA